MNAQIVTIPANQHRYDTCGDWWFGPLDAIEVRVTQQKDWRYELLVGIHELIEAALCKHRGVTEEEVTEFDLKFEEARRDGDTSEPGDDPAAPYYAEHQFATALEELFAKELDVDWEAYEASLEGSASE